MNYDRQVARLVGKEKTIHAFEEIGKEAIRRFAATIDDHNPLYWDEQFAKKSEYGGIVAPPTLIFEVNYDIGEEIDDSERARKWIGFGEDWQRAANEYQIFQLVRPDDVITIKHNIIEATEKQGKNGRLIFITDEVTYTNQRGELLGIDRETMALPIPES